MSSHEGFAAGLVVPVRPSLARWGLSITIHGAGLLALAMMLPLNPGITGFLAFALCLCLSLSLIHDLLQYGAVAPGVANGLQALLPSRLVQLHFSQGQWRGRLADGGVLDLELAGLLYTGRWFLVMRFRSAGSRQLMRVVIGRDTVSADLFRRLRVLLRYGPH